MGRIAKYEHNERVSLVRKLLSARMNVGDIKRAIIGRYGVCARTAQNYISRARGQLLAETGKDKDAHTLDAYSFYCLIVQDQGEATRDRLKAQERIDKLLGLEAPQKFDHSGTVTVETKELEQHAKRLGFPMPQLAARIAAHSNGHSNGNGHANN